MFPFYSQDEVIDDFIIRFSESSLSLSEEKAFMEVMHSYPAISHSAQAGKTVSGLLKAMPQHKAADTFEQKMAAAFALELEREKSEMNSPSPKESEAVS